MHKWKWNGLSENNKLLDDVQYIHTLHVHTIPCSLLFSQLINGLLRVINFKDEVITKKKFKKTTNEN